MIKRKLVWIASPLVFDRATRSSYRKAKDITMYVEATLSGPIGIPALQTYFITYHNAYLAAYDNWNANDGAQKGATSTLASTFKDLVVYGKSWDLGIQRVYSQGTPEYMKLLPKGRKPFYSGSQTDRIRAVHALSIAIGSDPLLAAVKSGVDSFYTAVMTNFNAQKDQLAQTKLYSDAVEAARISLCTALQYVKSSLETHYVDNPTMVMRYFPMELIHTKYQKKFTGLVPPDTVKEVVKRTMEPADLMDIENNGLGNMEFYWAANKMGLLPPGTTPLQVAPNTKMRVAASQLGDVSNPYLIVRNPSTIIEGEYVVSTE